MASSSSSFHSTPPTSWKYDVFLSFRGTDTRYRFVDHLYTALKQQGIGTFKDDEELPPGETIDPALLKAIEDSHIAVIVFSENYADSSWCLQELEHIMKCKVERGLIVIPIFYHVEPSEIRKQKRKYGEAFVKYESEKKNVESWRNALFDAGSLSGHVPNGPETIFIKNIVEDIVEKLCMAIQSDNEDLIGMEKRVRDLKSKLAIDSKGHAVMVGIWGLGGGGKTTLARALYDQISCNFDGCCFVNNIREESRRNGLEKLQEKILSCVLKQKKGEIVGDVEMLIASKLRRKKVLLVLDDVDNANQLEALAGSRNWFNEGSKIIITTRNRHILNTHEVNEVHNISLLDHDEAMKLFCKHALRHGNHIDDYYSLSNKVVSYARGLPLALKVLGSLLCDKDKGEWESALDRLKEIPEDDILETLKISYDGLKPIEKELFLDIACFFRGKVHFDDDPWEIFEACGFHPKIGVRVLVQKALIILSEENWFYSKGGWFDMHDLIQEMGHYIVRGKNPRNPEKHSRVWQKEDVVQICATPTEERTENHRIEALYARGPGRWERFSLMHTFPPNFPHAVANMKKLRWLSCNGYPGTSFQGNFQSTNLFYLRLETSSLKQLWEGNKNLLFLKVLYLGHSQELIGTPDFDGLPCLERIKLNSCVRLTCIHPSISHHKRLIYVNMTRCSRLEEFPPISGMKNLETLLLSSCSQLHEFPKIHKNMDKMVELCMKETGIKVVPSSIGKYCTNLCSLGLGGCKSLESIEGNFHLLEHLKEFDINHCKELKVPEEGLFDVNCCLEVLDLSGTSFKNLHPGILSMKFLGFSPSLRELKLGSCKWINGGIFSVLCKLSNLQVLDLSHSTFSRLDCCLLQLPRLKELKLSSCSNLVELPDLPPSIAILDASDCKSLKIVDLPTNLKWLWRISVSMESISGDVESKVQSMLEGNAIQDYSISLCFYDPNVVDQDHSISSLGLFVPNAMPTREPLTLELPRDWYNKFSGFLICTKIEPFCVKCDVITIDDDVMGIRRENEDVLESQVSEYDGTPEEDVSESEVPEYDNCHVCYIYIPFGSLKHTSWWNSTHTTISFSGGLDKVQPVTRRSKGDSIERVKDITNSKKYWDTEPIEVIHDSKSCIKIKWDHEVEKPPQDDVLLLHL